MATIPWPTSGPRAPVAIEAALTASGLVERRSLPINAVTPTDATPGATFYRGRLAAIGAGDDDTMVSLLLAGPTPPTSHAVRLDPDIDPRSIAVQDREDVPARWGSVPK